MKLALIAIQLEVGDQIVRSPDVYRAHLERTAEVAIEAAGPADQRLVVFPEAAGHLALLSLAPSSAHRAKTLAAALAASAVRKPLEVLRGIATTRLLDHKHAVLAALAPDGERFWRGVFGPLARLHGVHVVAGSHVRLGPSGDLTNASFLFAPDGRLLATTEKVNLVPGLEDRAPKGLGLSRGAPERVPIVDTPFGRLCTLIGYDAFHTALTPSERFEVMPERIAARGGARVIANPSARVGTWAASELRWQREGLASSLAGPTHVAQRRSIGQLARWGVTAHLVGRVLELAFEGASEILEAGPGGSQVLARAAHPDREGHIVASVTC